MFVGNNLKSFFFGSTKGRELRETREAWSQTQAYWRASPLAKKSLFDLSLEILNVAIANAERSPGGPVWNVVGNAVESLLREEAISELDVDWGVIEADVSAASEFRKMLTRRRRWSSDFDRLYGSFQRIVLTVLDEYFKALPESCYEEWDAAHSDIFEVPLIDLLDDPVGMVQRLFLLPYDDASFRFDIFYRLREFCAGNLLVASGFLRDANIREVQEKLILPAAQKKKPGAEIADLYLGGLPLKELLDLPVPFHIPEAARFEHCHIVGGTGHGKTQLMQKMIHADLVASESDGRSVIVIDSQGDLINKLVRLDLFSPDEPGSLAERLVIIDPADVEFPAALNLFDAHLERVTHYSAADRERVLNGVIELYELFFGAFLGAELTQKQGVIFKYLARLMLAIPNATIHTLMQIMEDGAPFKPYMERLDGSARYFFATEFFHPSFAATKKQVLRRLWGVLSTPAFERMFTQPRNKLDLFEAMNAGKIILINTAKDLLKREGSQLLGRFFIAMISQAALERSTLPERRRNAAFVYVDEAQEYFDDSIETILNQARKYHVGLTLAHQTLDQLSPRLRSALLANTSMKCAGGVSAKDARALAEELRTTPDFIEGMKRRGARSEFAVWVKNVTGQAIRLSVPLGFLERQPTLTEEDSEAIVRLSRDRYCGTLADIPLMLPRTTPPADAPVPAAPPVPKPEPQSRPEAASLPARRTPSASAEPPPASSESATDVPLPFHRARRDSPVIGERDLGKGGKQHRYLQSLVKELAEQNGLKATIEAPTVGGGQIDVLIERDGVLAAVEISITTPVEHERENLRKCLDARYPRIAVVLGKSKLTFQRYRAALLEDIPDEVRERIAFLTPEDIPEYILGLAPPPAAEERIVKGYRVKGTTGANSREDANARREAVARLIAKSIERHRR